MTEIEAIEELRYDQNELDKAIPSDTSWGLAINEAYNMAVKALERQASNHKYPTRRVITAKFVYNISDPKFQKQGNLVDKNKAIKNAKKELKDLCDDFDFLELIVTCDDI